MRSQCLILLCLLALSCSRQSGSFRFTISFSEKMAAEAQDGRLLLMLAKNDKSEPRMQINDGLNTQLIFGLDVEGMKPGQEIVIDEKAFGFPIRSIQNIPEGDYYFQVLLNRYETFKLKSGHTVKLPPDQGEGQHWNTKSGNFYSKPKKISIREAHAEIFKADLDQKIEPIKEPTDTKYIKHIKIQSKKLSEFYGRPMYLGAHVLVPEGFDTHPEAHYPLMVFHGHFPDDFGGFSTEAPDPKMDTSDYSDRFGIYGYRKFQKQEAYNFYKQWTSKNFLGS